MYNWSLCTGSQIKTDLDPQDLQDRLAAILEAEAVGYVVCQDFFSLSCCLVVFCLFVRETGINMKGVVGKVESQ